MSQTETLVWSLVGAKGGEVQVQVRWVQGTSLLRACRKTNDWDEVEGQVEPESGAKGGWAEPEAGEAEESGLDR